LLKDRAGFDQPPAIRHLRIGDEDIIDVEPDVGTFRTGPCEEGTIAFDLNGVDSWWC
jgi:hypothetical protein